MSSNPATGRIVSQFGTQHVQGAGQATTTGTFFGWVTHTDSSQDIQRKMK
jgi:hypothetical protein